MEKEELERKIENALKQPDTVVEGLFNVREGLEMLGKDERTTKQIQTFVARRLEELSAIKGNGQWIVRNQQRIYVDMVGKELIRFAADLMKQNTPSEFQNQFLKVTSKFRWNEHFHFSTYTSEKDFVKKHWKLSEDDINWYYDRRFDMGRKIGRSVDIYEDGKVETDCLIFGVDDSLLMDWNPYISISKGIWISRDFKRSEVEILPVKMNEFEKMFPDEIDPDVSKIASLTAEEREALRRELLGVL